MLPIPFSAVQGLPLMHFSLLFLMPGPAEFGILFVIILIIFGPGKLPDVCRALGDGVRQFKTASKDLTHEITGDKKPE